MQNRSDNKRFSRFLVVAVFFVSTVLSCLYSPLFAMDEKTYRALMLFSTVLEEIKENYVDETDPEVLVDAAIHGMMQTLDPHSVFLPPEGLSSLQDTTQGGFGGIGVSLAIINNKLTVIASIEGTPAHRAGIKTGDVISKIDNRSTRQMALWECETAIKGPPGTPVLLTYTREAVEGPMECRLTRDLVPKKSVHRVLLDPAGLGYIALTQFRTNTGEDLITALEDLESSDPGLFGLILDLRNNSGGHLSQAVAVSDLFLETGIIVSIKGRHPQKPKVFEAQASDIKREYPMVILINGGSASASEIVAGALQDHKRAVILGTPSFGKGSVQTVRSLPDGYGLKYTIARYFTPHNRSIQDKGIIPDIEVEAGISSPLLPRQNQEKKTREEQIIDLLKQDSQVDQALKILADRVLKTNL